jgi:hypothetical protein
MKTNSLSAALLICLLFCGCKPRETNLSGQAFIVTRGGENIKLGLLEVFLIDKAAATEFIKKKQPAVDAVIVSRQHDYELALACLKTTNTVDVGDDPYSAIIVETNYLAILNLLRIEKEKLNAYRNKESQLISNYRDSSGRFEELRSFYAKAERLLAAQSRE